MYWYSNTVYTSYFEILNINRDAAEGLIHRQTKEILLPQRISLLYIRPYRYIK